MSEIKALDELREYAEQCCPAYEDYDARMMEIADAIEAEIAGRFMELPVDVDGVPIHVGDLIEFGEKGERLEVTHFGWTKHGDPTIAYRRPNGTLDCSCIGAECRHVKPRTLEDVLRECGKGYYAHMTDNYMNYDGTDDQLIAKYADEIREMMEGVS